jgi:hypothetical protein
MTVPILRAVDVITTGDNIIVLNDDVTGAPTEDAGIEVERGTSLNAQFLWDETGDFWVAGDSGDLSRLVRYLELGSSGSPSGASLVGYDPSGSSLSSTDVQAALDELDGDLSAKDHGTLLGLADDDHTQYLTEARHDALPSDNPHGVTAAQVGNTVAQWNANQIQGEDISAATPNDGDLMVYDGVGSQWEPQAPPPPNTDRAVYSYALQDANINSTSFTAIGAVPWDDSRNSGYDPGVAVVALTASTNRDVELRVYDVEAATQLGITTVLAGAGFTIANFTITNPTADTRLELQVRKIVSGGNNGILHTATLEFER